MGKGTAAGLLPPIDELREQAADWRLIALLLEPPVDDYLPTGE